MNLFRKLFSNRAAEISPRYCPKHDNYYGPYACVECNIEEYAEREQAETDRVRQIQQASLESARQELYRAAELRTDKSMPAQNWVERKLQEKKRKGLWPLASISPVKQAEETQDAR